mmetsp:Transcript_96076/g.271676  ORF Transcript_96076/g.271676 Transcript_96076/m.271676 type:complete len:172 (-) Transcript_96076:134-649(-)
MPGSAAAATADTEELDENIDPQPAIPCEAEEPEKTPVTPCQVGWSSLSHVCKYDVAGLRKIWHHVHSNAMVSSDPGAEHSQLGEPQEEAMAMLGRFRSRLSRKAHPSTVALKRLQLLRIGSYVVLHQLLEQLCMPSCSLQSHQPFSSKPLTSILVGTPPHSKLWMHPLKYF